MGKRRIRKRTQTKSDASYRPDHRKQAPKSMVIRMGAGDVGPGISQLAKDLRAMMEPDTASRLKERRVNKLKDYVSMAGPLGVSHLLLLSRSSSGNTHLRVALAPRGPTLHFRVQKYSLSRDIKKSQRHPRGGGKEFATAPLLVMNNMRSPEDSSDPTRKQLEDLTTTIFQNMFPQISPQTTPLSTIQRIMLLNREPASDDGSFVLNLRHYAITTKELGVSKRVRRLDEKEQAHREKNGKALPNLNGVEDVANYLLDPGFTSASETEMDTDAEVEVLGTQTRRVLSKKDAERVKNGEKPRNPSAGNQVEKRAVKLAELGPRMKLRLIKVEEGVCEGKVMWNEFITKSHGEEKELERKWTQRKREKEERRKVQRENVEKKKQLNANTRANANGSIKEDVEMEDSSDVFDSEIFDSEMDDSEEEG